jgi:hypothetical protein
VAYMFENTEQIAFRYFFVGVFPPPPKEEVQPVTATEEANENCKEAEKEPVL